MSETADPAGRNLLHWESTRLVIGTFFEVYNELGFGFLESIYHSAMLVALRSRGLSVARDVPIEVFFRNAVIGRFQADLVVEGAVVVELNAARTILPEFEAQLIHYLRATSVEVGLLLNFGRKPEFKRLVFSNPLKSQFHPR